MLDANYKAIDLDANINTMNLLSEHQKAQLIKILKKFPTLFSRELGTIDIKPIHLEIKDCAKPKSPKPYPVPKVFEKLIKKDMQDSVE